MNLVVKVLRIIFAVFVLCFVGTIVVGFFLPNELEIESKLVINTNILGIREQVLNLNNWKNWNEFVKISDSKFVIVEQDSTLKDNAISIHPTSGNNLTVTFSKGDSLSGVDYKFYAGYKLDSTKSKLADYLNRKHSYMALGSLKYKETSLGMEVTKIYKLKLGWFPVNKLFGYLTKGQLENANMQDLRNLKKVLESNKVV